MNNQKKVIECYLQKFSKKPTLKVISADTGIQMSRVFRILNGSELKLSEFEILNKKLNEHSAEKLRFHQMIAGDLFRLDDQTISELNDLIERKIRYKLYFQ